MDEVLVCTSSLSGKLHFEQAFLSMGKCESHVLHRVFILLKGLDKTGSRHCSHGWVNGGSMFFKHLFWSSVSIFDQILYFIMILPICLRNPE